MISNKYVQDYIDLYENGKIQLNKERIMLLDYLQERVLTRDDLYFDETLIENFIKFAEKWYFPLQPFQLSDVPATHFLIVCMRRCLMYALK